MDLKETDILGKDVQNHWYYRSKAKAMRRLLAETNPSTILDIGAGSGFFSRYLLDVSSATEAWCVDISYKADSDSSESGKSLHFRRSIDHVNADLVLMMDVLEHVDDDVGLLREYAAKALPGTRFLISVPAFQFLWSGHDVFLEHKRRYRLNELEHLVMHSGLRVKHAAYYFGAVFPIAATIRLAERWTQKGPRQARSQLAPHHPLVNKALGALSNIELPLMSRNRFAGLTVFCVAEKP